MKHADSLYTILRGMIREEIDRTPGEHAWLTS